MTWYATGTVTTTKNSKVVTGVGTQWANPLAGVSAGRMLILQTSTVAEIYEIASVQSNTQLTLADNYGGTTGTGKAYKIPTSPSVSIEQFALEIAASLAYHQQQLDGWNQILTGTGDITLTAPNGQQVTIKSQKALADAIAGAVKKSGDTMTGELKIQKSEPKLFLLNSLGNGLILHTQENNNVLFSYAFDGKSDYKLAYSKELNTFIFRNLDDVEINGYSILKKGDGGLLSYTSTVEDMFSSDITTGFYRFAATSVNTPLPNSLGYVNKIAWNANEARVMVHMYNSLRAFTGFKDKNTGNISFAEFITTANSTVDSNGFYKKASPILRLYATDELDNVEGYTKAGYGLVNSEAHGVTAKRISVGHYEVYGSLGFAKEGWYITLPEDANGNKKIFAEYWADENNVITIKTYTKKFDFEKCEVVAGEPIDITDARWIDVRLEVPVIEIIEQEEPIPSTLNPIVSEVSE